MKLTKFFRRHPFMYTTRFLLTLSKPNKADLQYESCNQYVRRIPNEFRSEIKNIPFRDRCGSFENSRDIVQYMNRYYGKGPGLGYSSVENLKYMKNHRGGVCSDYSNVFTALCIARGILVREWGIVRYLRYRQNGHNLGHAFNEVYCDFLNKWILIDPFFGFYYESYENGTPLSASEFIDAQFDNEPICRRYLLNDKTYSPDEMEKIKQIYHRENMFLLLKSYKIFHQDKLLKYHRFKLLIPFLHLVLILSRRYHHYQIYINSKNISFVSAELNELPFSMAKKILPASVEI